MHDSSDSPHHFEFDLDRGIRVQVVEKLETSPLLPLEKGVGPPASGIYALYFKGNIVYVGKASKGTTKSKRTLQSRLSEHVAKIASRQNHLEGYEVPLSDVRQRVVGFRSGIRTHNPLQTIMERKRIRQQDTWRRASRN